MIATYFVEWHPEHGQLIRFGVGTSEEYVLPDWASFGRWDDNLQVIVTPTLQLEYTRAGLCWTPINGTILPATLAP